MLCLKNERGERLKPLKLYEMKSVNLQGLSKAAKRFKNFRVFLGLSVLYYTKLMLVSVF